MPSPEHDSFPRQQARTQRFTLGRPRAFTVAPDGSRIVFLRSFAGDDPATGLWVLDLPGARERLLFDPRGDEVGETDLPPEELARRGRGRERGRGVGGGSPGPAGARGGLLGGGGQF